MERYRARVDTIETEPATTLDGLSVSWHPTARHKALRFVDTDRLDEDVRDLFARPSEGAPYLAAVFVDPAELSFRSFENIVPLDRLFADTALDLRLRDARRVAPGAHQFALDLPDGARQRLEGVDALGLYVPPLNAATRGGDRFIFHSAQLAEALTGAVREALPDDELHRFSHVNPVFRCNRFEPEDDRFHRHRDTPYYDGARGQVSRSTLLLYLTGGTGEPALEITDVAEFRDIEAFSVVIFDQRHEHEGRPYRDGRKVFLRTELIYDAPADTTHDPEIGALFSKATYWTGQSVFAPELARYADACYNRVNAAHWSGLAPTDTPTAYAHKNFRGVRFVTDGHDFWFRKRPTPGLAECAALTLLDYFNCHLGGRPFREVAATETIHARDTAWIPELLAERDGDTSALSTVDKEHFFPAPEESNGACCPFHEYRHFAPARHYEIIDLYEEGQSFARAHLMPAPILMMGEEVALDPERFVIRGNQIHVLGSRALAPVNFAACWNAGGGPLNYLDVTATIGTADFLVPPILFSEHEGCYRLQFDFFRNNWQAGQPSHRQTEIPVPAIDIDDLGIRDEGEDDSPWYEALEELPEDLIPETSRDTF
ncbi:hypothetical protein GCM10022227_04620 [Streptomyces sedi]